MFGGKISLIFCCYLVLASGVYAFDIDSTAPSSTISTADSVTSKNGPHPDSKLAAPSSNTTTSPPETTTIPTSTTTAPTPAPTPVPDPDTGRWSINGTNAIIVLRMAAQIVISFNSSSEQSIKKQINIPIGNSTKVSGDFQSSNETIKLSWKESNATGENSVSFVFKKDEPTKTYILGSVDVFIDASELPVLNSSLSLVHPIDHFNTTLRHSYRCAKLQSFNLTKPENNTIVFGQLKVTNFQFQAFKDDGQSNFGLPEDCSLDTSDVVPIVVGCVLAGLVIIMLVAYLISRKRSQARGYTSM